MSFWIDFWSIHHPDLAPNVFQNRTQSGAKMRSIFESIFRQMFYLFRHRASTPWTSKMWKLYMNHSTFQLSGLKKITTDVDQTLATNLVKTRQGAPPDAPSAAPADVFSPIWPQTCIPKGDQHEEKTDSKNNSNVDVFLDRFLVDSPSRFGSQSLPKSHTNRCQDAIHFWIHF